MMHGAYNIKIYYCTVSGLNLKESDFAINHFILKGSLLCMEIAVIEYRFERNVRMFIEIFRHT